ncbi:F-box/WD-40 repeat-containing protein 1-like [Nicotiana tabacum]|uniref:F-box/WD-40 repeat-containing protein 1-like n=2 Tax=Nicotiana tabacum TaxID=4097 RepID=A0A1S3YMA9_TOBAC|nr:PREDICTED: F-box/WD-40 repeat-containing protein 1-like [Nicotiana tabacum]
MGRDKWDETGCENETISQRRADLPNEITITILAKLAVKSLLRFKIVSKQWHSWISHPEPELSKQRQGRAEAILNDGGALESRIYKNKYLEPCLRLLGSCNGLVLIISENKHIFLWNPATRFSNKVIELYLLISDEHVISAGGLCFDFSKNEYKVLLYVYNKSVYASDGAYALVASLKDKKWRRIEIPYDMFSARDGIKMHGRLHSRTNLEDNYFDMHESLVGRNRLSPDWRSMDDDDEPGDEDADTKWKYF